MSNENSFEELLKTSLSQIDSNTVIGTPVQTAGGVTVIPVSKFSMGFASGDIGSDKKDETKSEKKIPKLGSAGGSGISLSPIGFLVVSPEGRCDFLSVNGKPANDPVEQIGDILDRTPEIVAKIKNLFRKKDKKGEENEPVVEEITPET